MNNKIILVVLCACIGIVALTGVAAGDEPDKEWSFEQDLNESWNIISDSGGPIERNETYHTNGFYSMAWSDTGTNYQTSRVRTRDIGFIDPEYSRLSFQYYELTNPNEENADEIEVRLITPEENIIIYGHIPYSDLAYVGGSKAEYVQMNDPPNNQWNNVTMTIEGTEITTEINDQTLTTNMSEPIQNPDDVKIEIQFYQSGFDDPGTTYFVDNMQLVTSTPGLTALQTPDIAVIGVFLVVILFAAVRLRSPATVVSWVLLALSAIGILAFDVDFLIFWIAALVAIITVAISGIVYYAER